MRRPSLFVCTLAAMAFAAGASAQGRTTSTETKNFEIVSVDGNTVVVKGAQGAQEIKVPDDFRLTVDGKPVTVKGLKPGMKGTATITTTTTTTPVYVTEIRNGQVMQVSGNSIIVRSENGIAMYNEGQIEKRGVKIIKDGRQVAFSDLHTGDRLTATIVTEGAPQVVTERDVQARMTSPPPPPAPARPAETTAAAAPVLAPAATAPVESAAANAPPANTPAASTGAPAAAEQATAGSSSWLMTLSLGAIVLALLVIVMFTRRKQAS